MDPFMTSSTTTATVPTVEVEQLLVTPTVGSQHHRAHPNSNSRITSYDDLARFDPFDINFIDGPPPLPDVPTAATMASPPEELSYLNSVGSIGHHIQSLSMDSDLLDFITNCGGSYGGAGGRNDDVPVNPSVHVAQGVSTDGSTNNVLPVEADLSIVMKHAMPPEKLARLAATDPKRAKRILANRESAARSKEKKVRYTVELENKAQILEEKSAEISVKLSKIVKENSDMKADKKLMLCETESMEERAKIIEELNETLRYKLRQHKKEYTQKVAYKHHNFRGLVSPFSSQLAMHQTTLVRSWKAQQQQQHLVMPPSHSDSEDSDSDSQN